MLKKLHLLVFTYYKWNRIYSSINVFSYFALILYLSITLNDFDKVLAQLE